MSTQPQQHHRLSTCHRHPSLKPLTGFCAACLRERLAGIDPDTHEETPPTQLAAELRRTKSYSSSTIPNASSSSATSSTFTTTATTSEPRRKSCDVGPRNSTLSDLFHTEDKRKGSSRRKPKGAESESESGLEHKGKEENVAAEVRVAKLNLDDDVDGFEDDGEFKTMKEFIDLELEDKKKKKNGGGRKSLWEAAASVSFGKRLVKWQTKEHREKGKGHELVDMDKSTVRKLRDTQSAVGEYAFGRRSCDADLRLSVDVARLSVDDSRYSFDEPRASWDGCLIGKTYPRLLPLVSVMEDVVNLPSGGEEEVKENDVGIMNNGVGECSPGGTAQTRDYYYSSERRKRSFDRSAGIRGLGDDELKCVMNAKVSPETVELFHGAKLLVTEKELRDSNWYSLKDHRVESIDSLSKDVGSVAGGVDRKAFKSKKLHKWRNMWNIWGLMQWRSETKYGDEVSSAGANGVDLPITESWHKLRGVANGETNGTVSQKLIRSFTVSAKDASQMACGSSVVDTKENGVKRTEGLMLQRNQSARYPPNNLDTSLLKFYLTPLRSYGRSKSGKGGSLKNSNSLGTNVL